MGSVAFTPHACKSRAGVWSMLDLFTHARVIPACGHILLTTCRRHAILCFGRERFCCDWPRTVGETRLAYAEDVVSFGSTSSCTFEIRFFLFCASSCKDLRDVDACKICIHPLGTARRVLVRVCDVQRWTPCRALEQVNTRQSKRSCSLCFLPALTTSCASHLDAVPASGGATVVLISPL